MNSLRHSSRITTNAQQKNNVGLFAPYKIMFFNLIEARELVIQLFKRDFFSAYKKSFFGAGWILISPIVGVVSWVMMSSTGILNPGDVGAPYTIYILMGTTVWGLFTGFYNAGETTLSAGATFILQVKYPHEVLLIKQTAHHLANFLISFGLNIFAFIIFDFYPSWKIIFFPILVIPLFFLGAGLGLTISVFSVVTPEIQKAFNIFLNLLIFVTPVIYTKNVDSPILRTVMSYNPLTYLISACRDIILHGTIDNMQAYLISAGFSFIVFLLGLRFFYVSEEIVIEKMA